MMYSMWGLAHFFTELENFLSIWEQNLNPIYPGDLVSRSPLSKCTCLAKSGIDSHVLEPLRIMGNAQYHRLAQVQNR